MAVSFGQFRVVFLVRVSGHICLLQPAAVVHQGTFGWNLGAVASLHGKNDCRHLGKKRNIYRIHKTTLVHIYIKLIWIIHPTVFDRCVLTKTHYTPRVQLHICKKKKITSSVQDCWTKDSAYIWRSTHYSLLWLEPYLKIMFGVMVSAYYLQSIGYKFESYMLYHFFFLFYLSSAIPNYYSVLCHCTKLVVCSYVSEKNNRAVICVPPSGETTI
jgi:hypothetical protein